MCWKVSRSRYIPRPSPPCSWWPATVVTTLCIMVWCLFHLSTPVGPHFLCCSTPKIITLGFIGYFKSFQSFWHYSYFRSDDGSDAACQSLATQKTLIVVIFLPSSLALIHADWLPVPYVRPSGRYRSRSAFKKQPVIFPSFQSGCFCSSNSRTVMHSQTAAAVQGNNSHASTLVWFGAGL